MRLLTWPPLASFVVFIAITTTVSAEDQASDGQWREDVKETAEVVKGAAIKAKDKAVEYGKKAADAASEAVEDARESVADAEQQRQENAEADPERKKPGERFFYR